jgi:hypothetical protein
MDEKKYVVNCNKMMSREKMMGDYERTKDVILSCKTPEQLKVGIKMYNQLTKLHNLPTQYVDKLDNVVELMKIKCGVHDMYEGMSNIGKDFKKAAVTSGNPELQKIMFSEEEDLIGGEGDDMSIKDIADYHKEDVKKIKREIEVGTKIEMEHTKSKNVAKEIAIDHISEISDYYTNPDYGILAVEDMKGQKKSIRISKKEMERLHKTGKLDLDGVSLSYREDLSEDLDSNEIAQKLRDQLRNKSSKRFSKDEIFDEIRRRREEEMDLRKKEAEEYRKFIEDNFTDEEETEEPVEEASSAGSVGGSYVGALSRKPIRRKIKTDIPVSVGGINRPIGNMTMLGEEELVEASSAAVVGGEYATPGFPPSAFMGTAGKKGKARVKKEQPSLDNLGYQKVRVKEKCKTFPYCNQSPEAIEFYNESKIIKTIKKGDLKIKK